MANEPSPDIIDAKTVNTEQFHQAKVGFWASAGIKMLAACLATGLVLNHKASASADGALVALAFIAEGLDLYSDKAHGEGQALLRQIELQEGLGTSFKTVRIQDYLATMKDKQVATLRNRVRQNYFASSSLPGPVRLLQNLEESSWWTWHLSRIMFKVAFGTLLAVCFLAFFALYAMVAVQQRLVEGEVVAEIIVGVVSLGIAVGLVKRCVGVSELTKKAKETTESAESLLTRGSPTEAEALTLLAEYQVARATSPLLPTLVWKRKRDALNQLWVERCRESK